MKPADLGMPFLLWDAPMENAVAEKDAQCKYCRAVGWTFGDVCYTCLRAGKATDRVMGTELGLVRLEDAERLGNHDLLELLRTPQFHSWQEDTWLICCDKPCVFLGDLPESERTAERVVELFETFGEDVERFLDRIASGGICTYAFRCRTCKTLRAYWDTD